MPVLEVDHLSVNIPTVAGELQAVRDISFHVEAGETLCLVGESGCGKSMTSLALMGLLPPNARRSAARIALDGDDLLQRSTREMSHIRGKRMAMIFQEPMTSLNPAYTVGDQLEEAYRLHNPGSRQAARDRALALLEMVGISGGANRLGSYPHQLSGGQRQRIMIAMALMCEPRLLIADEPTTALDVTIQAQILSLLVALQRDLGMALVLITHDLGVVANVAHRVAVMYAGEVVETGASDSVLASPRHPYTQGLLACLPIPGETPRGARLGAIAGIVPSLVEPPSGCIFANRCAYVTDMCRITHVPLREEGGVAYRCLFTPAERAARATAEAVLQ
jgi:peptide/nickel transport system ATP-binding protein